MALLGDDIGLQYLGPDILFSLPGGQLPYAYHGNSYILRRRT